MTAPTPQTIATWKTLVQTSQGLIAAIEAALKAADLPPLEWYDALLEIEKAGPVGIRPFELKQRLLLAQYSTSRLLDRMEKAGVIARRIVKDDGRGQIITLSESGREKRSEAWVIYAAQLTAHFEGAAAQAAYDALTNIPRNTSASP